MKQNNKPALVEERFFPFECSTSYGVEEEYKVLHWHQEMEICYIKHGTGKYLINGIEYNFSQGDIFLISNDEIHLCYDDKDLVMQVTMFDPNFLQNGIATPFDYDCIRPFVESSECFCNKLNANDYITAQLSEILLDIETEYVAMQKGYTLMIKAMILKFLALIIRHCFANDQYSSKNTISQKTSEKIRQIITYIDDHYSENINLKFISEHFDISKPYLCSAFKTLTGNSLIDFLIKKRIIEAKILLSTTDRSILKISEECGFGSLSNFNHQFKSLVGYSPSEYRKLYL